MKIVAEIPDEIIDIISKSDTTIGRRELAIKANISENLARHYLQLWNSRLGDSDPRTIGMQDILKEKVSKQAKVIKKLQKELATGDIVLDSMKDFVPVLDIKSKIPDCKYSKDKIDAREVIAIWNDWHAGEVIDPAQVEGLNEYNMQIMAGRIWNLVRGTIRIINLNKSIFNIDTLNIDLLGDMLCILPDMFIQDEYGNFNTIEDIYNNNFSNRIVGRLSSSLINKKYRKYFQGNVCEIKCAGSIPVKCSKEHKWLVIPDEKIEKVFNIHHGGFWQRKKKFISIDAVEEKKTQDIKPGDYFLSRGFRTMDGESFIDISSITNIDLLEGNGFVYEDIRGNKPKVKNNIINIDDDFLRYLGLFIAEGCTAKSRVKGYKNVAQFTFNISETYLAKDIYNITKKIFGDFVSVKIIERPDHNVLCVYIYNKIIATLLHILCGQHAENKKIHEIIWRSPVSLLPLIGGWLDGDGTTTNHQISGKTISKQLAFQVRASLLHEGIFSYIHTEDVSKYKNHKSPFVVYFSGKYAKAISKYTTRFDYDSYVNGYEEGIWVGPYYAQRVKKVEQKYYEGYVYDLQIKGDPYYQVNSYISHNSGNIHDELIQTNEMPILQTTMATAYIAAQAIVMLTEHFRKIRITGVGGNHGRCLSKSMELLTKSGWKSYDEIEENEIIPTMNLETGCTEYQSIEQIHIYENDPTIVKTTGKINSGLEMTPDHSLINYDDRKKEFRKKYLVKDIINLKGGIKIPRYSISNTIDIPNISDDLLELLGIIITDGSVIKDSRKICIYQSKPYNIPYIENLLNKNKINYTKSVRHRNITEVCGKKLKKKPFDENVFIVKATSIDYLLNYVLSRDIQDWMFDLSDRQVKILLKGIVLANGSIKPSGKRIMHDGKEYFVKEDIAIYGEKYFLDKLQALLVTHGRSCTLSKDNRGDYILHLLGNYFSILNKKVLIEEDYNDTTWCVTVPNGSIFVRNKYNGRVFVVGNTTQKYQFKNKALNNYDILFYQILSVLLAKYIDENIIEFNIPESSECIMVRSGWAFLLGHSDHIRGWSGIPWYGFQRDNAKQQKIRKLRSVLSVNENNMQPAEELNGAIINMKNARGVYGYDFRECGHWHTMSIVDDWTTIISGALVGTSEFSLNKLHATASPTQTLAFLSEKYGLKGIEPIHCVDEGHNFNIFREGVLGEYAKALGEFISSE